MKKNLFIVLLISMVAILAACGANPSNESQEPTNGSTGETSEPATPEEQTKLVVGTDAAFAPFESLDGEDIVGFDVDLLDAVMEEAGLEYELNNIGWDPIFLSLKDGSIDLAISGITVTEERDQEYDFTRPYFESTHMIAFYEGTDIESANDLEGKIIGVQTATTGQIAAEAIVGELNPNLQLFETTALAFASLKEGNVEAVVTDIAVAAEFVKNNPEDNVKLVSDPENFEAEYYGMMVPEGSELKETLDKALTTIIDNGKYAEIYEKWFGSTPNLETLLEQE
ncbi:basic amino acid ABC transporter substrate-binding protein [Chengkuizengella marina]|uniref:Basic amino acid ABC transporter substrate-binding protein n=1 Tax=Chengkuizengella marina TaxID=2507566 RepID=A0A6N9Q4B9_9BACL|nr:basic amino acid ABC transporter substrate-binding protein [Chengkuizengella marina]NBI29633.1 basic amino acid ABC transporter substrate-binding protein [Chengkuizengella marina]